MLGGEREREREREGDFHNTSSSAQESHTNLNLIKPIKKRHLSSLVPINETKQNKNIQTDMGGRG